MARKKQETMVLFPEIMAITRKFTDEQFGILMRAAFSYRFSGETYSGDDIAVDVAFQAIVGQIDRYREFCGTLSSNAKGSNDAQKEARGSGGEQSAAKPRKTQQSDPPCPSPCPGPYPGPYPEESTGAGKPPARKSYGEFGWVKLTEEEYCRLAAELGAEETSRCIAYVDESAQTTGNKNRWKDWNLVVRKCHKQGWGGNPAPPQKRELPPGVRLVVGADGISRFVDEGAD